MTRNVDRVFEAQETSEGAGVRLKRALGTAQLSHLDPFLLLDEFKSDDSSDYVSGFPDHPHRGFETVTYMLAGSMQHRDHLGNEGNLRAGSVQWMTAGRGIIHSEMPQQEDGLLWGFQLWVNLPSALKMTAPRYQDIPPDQIPEVNLDGAHVRVVAGRVGGVSGAVTGAATDPTYLDVAVRAGDRVTLDVPADRNACCYVFEGAGTIGGDRTTDGTMVRAGQLAVLTEGRQVAISGSDRPVRLLLLAAVPIGEPIARYGPFVMTTQDEIREAIEDVRRGRLGTA